MLYVKSLMKYEQDGILLLGTKNFGVHPLHTEGIIIIIIETKPSPCF